MESGIQSSFIPQDAAEALVKSARPYRSGGLPEFLLLVAIVLLVASAALAAGVFLYKQYLETASKSKLAQLERAKSAFEPALIQQLTRLDDRMHAGEAILGSHLAPSVYFDALQQATLATISFSNLTLDAGDGQHVSVHMSGVAQSVNSIALQAQILAKNGVITSPIFSGIDREKDGVHFNLSALVNPTAINYVGQVAGAASASALPATPSGPASPFNGPSVSNQGQ
ncbi:hypothetical protein HY968_01850 [Candidatus Kaiserbacteria bacterium]|nr:hypothetical protein [Candidatus Kaiserbacteria bacterium]